MIKAKNISHKFDKELFSNINIDLDIGDSLAIIGRSGSGKSTLLHILSSFLKPDKGEVFISGENLYNNIEKIRREEIGIVFQDHFLLNGMSVRENLNISENISGNKMDEITLKTFNIYELLDKKVSELSGGEKQRVSIARVLVKKPTIIFGDEITSNLDIETRNIVIEMLLKYIKEKPSILILVTHDNEIANLCKKKLEL